MSDTIDASTGEVLSEAKGGALAVLEATPESALAVRLAREELQVQMDQARAYPRSVHRVMDMVNTLATLDAESAAGCLYSIPRDGKVIEGPSIRFAEIVAGCYGNNTYAGRVTDIGDKFVEAEGVHFDLQTNSRVIKRVQRRITTARGARYGDDMIGVTGNAAISIALRNAVLSAVPRGLWAPAFVRVRQVVMGDIQTLANRRAAAVEAFTRFGVTEEQVCIALGVEGLKDITLEMMVPLAGMFAALNSGESDPSEMFATVEKPAAKARRLSEGHGQAEAAKAAPKKAAATPAPKAEAATPPAEDATARPTGTGSAPSAEQEPDTSASATDASAGSPDQTASGPQDSGEPSKPSEPEQTRAATAEEKAAAKAAGQTQPEDPALASQSGGTGIPAAATDNDLFPGDPPPLPKDAAQARAAAAGPKWPDVVERVSPEEALEAGFYHLSTDAQNAHGQRPYYDDQGRCRGVCNAEAARLEEFGDHPSSLNRAGKAKAEPEAPPPAEDAAPPAEEQTGDAPAEDAFQTFRDGVEEAESWGDVKRAFLALSKTEAFKAGGPAKWREESTFAWRKTEALMRAGDELDYTQDLLAFRLYVEAATDAKMVQGAWMAVTQGAAYKGLEDGQKTQLGRAVAARLEELSKAAG